MAIPLMGLPIKQDKYVIHLQPVNSNIFICNDPTFYSKKVFWEEKHQLNQRQILNGQNVSVLQSG